MPDGFVIVGLDVISLNAYRVFLRGIGDVGSQWDAGSVLRPGSWRIDGLDPDARYRLAQAVQLVTPSPDPVVDVFTDGILTPGKTYRMSYVPSDGSFVSSVVGCDSVDFLSVPPDAPSDVRQRFIARDDFNDIANPQLPRDQVALGAVALGTFTLDSTGDLAQDSGLLGLRKRVIRRVSSARGAFFHLLDYGLDAEIKALLTPDRAARIAARARSQILREPDVEQCSVAVSSLGAAPNVLSLRLQVKPRGQDAIGIDVALSPPNAPR